VYRNQLEALDSVQQIDPFVQTVLVGDVWGVVSAAPSVAPVFRGVLTAEQVRAVEHSLTHRVGFIDGGAGTGMTLCAIHHAVSLARVGRRCLVISLANDSCDNLARKILKYEKEVRRVCTQSARHF
jgi:hypothetical protein